MRLTSGSNFLTYGLVFLFLGVILQLFPPAVGVAYVSLLASLVFLAFGLTSRADERVVRRYPRTVCRNCGATWYGPSKYCPSCGKEQGLISTTGLS